MDFAVDTNILLASFKPQSVTRKIMAIETFHFFTTEYQISELKEYLKEISDKYHLTNTFIEQTMLFLDSIIEVLPRDEYIYLLKDLQDSISDQDDLPLLALATAKRLFIWSNDLHFKEQDKIVVFTTSEILDYIKEGRL